MSSDPTPAPFGLEPLHPLQIAAWRKMTPTEKWNVALGLQRTARAAIRARTAQAHPDWSPEQLDREVARCFLHARR